MFLKEFNIFEAHPDAGHDLLSSRDEDEAYVSYTEDEQYAVFFTDGG